MTEAECGGLLEAHGDVLFLSYWIGKSLERRRVYVVVAKGRDDISVVDLGPGVAGHERYQAALAAVRNADADPWPALAAAAAFFLPESVTRRLPPGVPVVLCADAEIGDLPFEALRVGGQPFGVRNVVYRTPSLAILRELRSRQPGSSKVLVFDSVKPSAIDQKLYELSELDYSGAEGDAISRLYPDHVRVRRDGATYDALKEELAGDRFDILHVSCHAIHHPWIPSASLLMLRDGPMDMGTLATLRFDGMIVVFSTCSSVGSERAGGEGVKGLLWGPLAAGARAVVASRWEMNQQATKDLMAQFHHHVATGSEPGEAMRRGRATLAASSNYAHPAYWAGFGVFAAPPSATDPWFDVWIIGFGILLLGFSLWGLRRALGSRAS